MPLIRKVINVTNSLIYDTYGIFFTTLHPKMNDQCNFFYIDLAFYGDGSMQVDSN